MLAETLSACGPLPPAVRMRGLMICRGKAVAMRPKWGRATSHANLARGFLPLVTSGDGRILWLLGWHSWDGDAMRGYLVLCSSLEDDDASTQRRQYTKNSL